MLKDSNWHHKLQKTIKKECMLHVCQFSWRKCSRKI